MDNSVRYTLAGSLHDERLPATPRLWAKVHAYLGHPIPLAALLRRPWVHLRHPPPTPSDMPSTQGATVLPFRRRQAPTHLSTQERNHD